MRCVVADDNVARQIWKERQQFTLVNLVAILELEGNGLVVNENGTWGLQE